MGDEVNAGSAVVPSPADWRTHLSDELKADPVVSSWAEKATEKDIGSVLKSHAHLSKRMGSAVNLPGKDAKPDEVAAFKQRLIEAGVVPAPPKDISVYGNLKPEKLPEGLSWDDATAKTFGETLLKHGASKELAQELIALHEKVLLGTQQTLSTAREASLAKLKAEHGEKYDERMEMAERLAQGIFTDPEEVKFFEETGIGRSPRFQSVMMRLAPLAMQDSSFVESLSQQTGSISGQSALAEYADIISNEKNERHAGWKRSDPQVMQYVTELYRKAYPGNIESQKSLVATA